MVEAPPEKLESVLNLVKEIMKNPRFDKKTFEDKKRRSLTNRAAMDDDMQSVISYFASRYVFDYHPTTLDGTGTVKTISSVTMGDLKKHMSSFFDPKRVFAASFGPMKAKDIKKLIDKTIFTDKVVKFEKFPYDQIDVKKYIPKTNKVVLINKPGSRDNQVLYIYPQKFKPATKSYLQYKLANYFVGGNSEALLFKILREERGLTYGAYSMLGRNSWGIWTFASNDKVERLIAGTNEIISGLKTQKYSQKDLDLTKLDLTTRYKENHELPSDSVMEEIGAFASSEDLNYYKDYLNNLEAVKLAEVTQDIRSGFAQKPGYLIVMGDKKLLMNALKNNGYKNIKLLSISDIK
jgi:predicted Zn-dependent peptidase